MSMTAPTRLFAPASSTADCICYADCASTQTRRGKIRPWGFVTSSSRRLVEFSRPGGMCACPAGNGKGTCALCDVQGYERPALAGQLRT